MLTSNRSEERMTSAAQQSVEKAVAGPDPSWRGLYKAGGVSAILYVVLAVAVPTVQVFCYRTLLEKPVFLSA